MTADTPPEYVLSPTPVQERLIEVAMGGTARQILTGGGIRGGKTYGSLLLLTLLARVYPGSRWAITRRTLVDLRRTVIPTWQQMFPPGFWHPINKSEWTATAVNGSQVVFFPESIQEDPELNRWNGLEVNGFIHEEGNELAERSFQKSVVRAGAWIIRGAPRQPPPLILTTTNPAPGWVKRLFYDPWKARTLPAHRAFVPALAADNPFIPDAVRASWEDLPEREYHRFILGEWDDLTGAALDELDEDRHLVDPFPVPEHWPVWAAFDWGRGHPAVWMWLTEDERGRAYLVDTFRARRMRDDQLAQGIIEAAPKGFVGRMLPCEAGHDAWTNHEHKQSRTPDTAEVFGEYGLTLKKANIARVQGLNNLIQWLAWRPVLPGLPEREPRLRIMRTPANLRVFDRLKEIMLDPDRPNDALKVDADPETGEGGDDDYDALRYGLASRPAPARPAPLDPTLHAWSPEVLAYEAERAAMGLPMQPDKPPRQGRRLRRSRRIA